MLPAQFDYVAPTSLDEAISLLQQHGDDAKLLAGGHSLLPLMKLRLAVPAVLIDLGHVRGLTGIREAGDHIAVGAMTTYADLEESELLQRRVPLLARAASMVGDPQVRARGTLGGALAHADPAGDMPAIVSALGGSVVARGPRGERTIAIDDLFSDIFTSALEPEEILTEIRITPQDGAVGSYQKFRRRAIDWAIVGAAVNLRRTNGSIASAGVVLTNVGPTPMRARSVEEALRGQPASEETIAGAAERAAEGLDPSGEIHASPDYKRHLATVLTRRALQEALRAG